jgi:hypothetical protein
VHKEIGFVGEEKIQEFKNSGIRQFKNSTRLRLHNSGIHLSFQDMLR